jgi:hypothetical protein
MFKIYRTRSEIGPPVITHNNTDQQYFIHYISMANRNGNLLYWLLNDGIYFINTVCKMRYSILYTAGPELVFHEYFLPTVILYLIFNH